jgi:hypothetical protein
MSFEAFPKIPRLSRQVIVTEKIDGTNAQVYIEEMSGLNEPGYAASIGSYRLYAGSRTRLITPGKETDNYGFAAWVRENAQELVHLGPGRHFGEWYGKGIQRNYGLTERRFALFNTSLWNNNNPPPSCCSVVPVLCSGELHEAPDEAMGRLLLEGSIAAPGFNRPEGIVVFHTASRTLFKRTFDDKHKEAA